MKDKLSSEQRLEIAEKYQQGVTIKNLAQEYQVTIQSIGKTLKKLGVRVKPKAIEFNSEQEQEIIERYKRGETSRQIGKVFGVSMGVILKVVEKHKVPFHGLPHLNSEQKEEVVKLYNKGMTTYELVDYFNVGYSVINNVLKAGNINKTKIRQSHKEFLLFTDKGNEIVQKYNSGISSVKLAKEYKVSFYMILRILRDKGVKINDNSVYTIYTRHEDYFEQINTRKKAYILGFLYTDGCNSTENHLIRLGLQEADIEILEKINIELGSNKPIEIRDHRSKIIFDKYRKQYRTATLSIVSRKMSQDLEKWGVVKAKTFLLTFPTFLEDYQESDFVRGAWDGDGHIGKNIASFVGNRQFCEKLHELLTVKLGFKATLSFNKRKPYIYTIILTGMSNLKKFLNWMYQDAELYLERKYKKYLAIRGHQPQPRVKKEPKPKPISLFKDIPANKLVNSQSGTPLSKEELTFYRKLISQKSKLSAKLKLDRLQSNHIKYKQQLSEINKKLKSFIKYVYFLKLKGQPLEKNVTH